MGRPERKVKRVDYARALNKYDGESFISTTGFKTKRRRHPTASGRANAAPTLTRWPFNGMHHSVEYVADINSDMSWSIQFDDDVQLPFAHLSIRHANKWQGLIQQVSMDGCPVVRAHFNAITSAMLAAKSNPVITECVGEAAAAMAMLDDAEDWEMIWGFHLHSGTGIDQIWRASIGNGLYKYRIVEAKGPGASLNWNPFLPPDYNQMQLGWVLNHLYSMQQNKHSAGVDICTDLKLAFKNLHPNFDGAAKSYWGLASPVKSSNTNSRLTGVVVTARWLSDGRLHYYRGNTISYL